MNIALFALAALPIIVVIVCLFVPGVTSRSIAKIAPTSMLTCGIGFAVCAQLQDWNMDTEPGRFAVVFAISYILTALVVAVLLRFVLKSQGL